MASLCGPIGNTANIAQLVGLDAVRLIALIVKAAANARMHKTKCKALSGYVQMICDLIEPFNLSDLNDSPATSAPLKRLEDELKRAYLLVKSCQDRSFPYLFIMGWKIERRFRTAEEEIDRYLKLIPVINQVELRKLTRERRGSARKDQPQDSTYGDPVQNAPSSSGLSGRVTNRNHGVKDAVSQIFKSRKSLKDQIKVESNMAEVSQERQPRIFRLHELWVATNHFAVENIIGRGEFTNVYRGIVDDNIPVAVKKWESYADGLQEWENEMNVLGNMRHPNLIKLLGCCNGDNEIILVYELMNNGDLERIFDRGDEPLSWQQRIKIATGVAGALAFLHTPEKNIIHRVIKPSVILLDWEFNVKLSGLGCSREGPTDGATEVSTQLMGTAGYVDPEYAMTGHLDAKADVYAFGIVMLQLLSGLKVFDRSRPRHKQHLVSYASDFIYVERRLHKFMDPKLGCEYQSKHAFELAKLCGSCTSNSGNSRPDMKTVLEVLESICPSTS
ncbi:probable serine/threonine-protein kinase PBL11 isoform X1 [Zingiber officinale]|uniref:probable serine/threonine-protein kinase PBL11 isoform X1 n=1 Tax=Zingiber officinale TaxID=94328 RepID=UPI001C4D7775|nr:probable serine/threonine-protein kinase PBL11 isoform X1 [Zingiber officinale]XP_042469673.1 probable serine/threonine-protein kinase PBL11 isoform X1 [Zingiber officinale]